jgi:hypothetical protein
LLESKDGALRNLESSIFNVRFPAAPLPVVPATLELLVASAVEWPLLLQLWLKSCQGTGMSLPIVVLPVTLPGVPETLDRLEGAVSRPEVDVSVAAPDVPIAAPADDKDNTANSTWPDCGFTVKSRMYPSVFPSFD